MVKKNKGSASGSKNSNQKTQIEEPAFNIDEPKTEENKELTPGQKKLQRQEEKRKRDEEEEAQRKAEKEKVEKRTKTDKKKSKSSTKQTSSKKSEESAVTEETDSSYTKLNYQQQKREQSEADKEHERSFTPEQSRETDYTKAASSKEDWSSKTESAEHVDEKDGWDESNWNEPSSAGHSQNTNKDYKSATQSGSKYHSDRVDNDSYSNKYTDRNTARYSRESAYSRNKSDRWDSTNKRSNENYDRRENKFSPTRQGYQNRPYRKNDNYESSSNYRNKNQDYESYRDKNRSYQRDRDSRYDKNSSFQDRDEDFEKFRANLNKVKMDFGKVKEITGDLFSAPKEYSLAHCVAEDLSMGAGIALSFRKEFKGIGHLSDQNVKVGGVAILERGDRFIYYLVTKKLSHGKPILKTLWQSLNEMKKHMIENKVTKLAIPQIGCGLDLLDWGDVKQMLEYIFKDTDVEITVYNLDRSQTVSFFCIITYKQSMK